MKRFFVISAFSLIFIQTLIGQETSGKSYTNPNLKRPNSAAPNYPSPVTFSDVTGQTGINFHHFASPTTTKYLPETTGGGIAIFDFDNDGLMDLFFTNGAEISEKMPKNAMPEKTNSKFWDRLFRQLPDGKFTDVTEKAGVAGTSYSFGVAVGDFNKDGFQDLFVTRYGGASLFRNNGNGNFTDITSESGIKVDGWATSAGFFDFNRDGRLDLFVTRYLDWNFENGGIYCGEMKPGFRAYCHPDNFQPVTSLLFRQNPDRTFTNVSESSGISHSKGKALGLAFADFDDDGWTDIFVANDTIDQQLFRNQQDGTFAEIALSAGVAFDDNGKPFAGMGVDVADFDNDGKQDIFITAFSGETFPFFHNSGELIFDYVTRTSGIGQNTMLGTGWGTKFIDADNDGRRDIFLVQSHPSDNIEMITSFLKYKQPLMLLRNMESGFQNVSLAAGDIFQTDLAARGLACGDINNDGMIDAVVAQTNETPVILRNNGTKNNWIGLDLRGTNTTPNGEGARVKVIDSENRQQVFDVSNSGSYLSANDQRLIIGLGTAKNVISVEIRWNNGKIQKLNDPEINRYHLVKET
ncbi:MAG TPA: CRTAC1 family protein [Pyrinomonadaceae bacterium]|nr:CRTAC1 family protein [Pyrinomonadaceae bacterium]